MSDKMQVKYTVKFKPKNEMLAVQLYLANLKNSSILFQIRRSYGSVPENHYADSVHNLEVYDAEGNRLNIKRMVNRQWKVNTGGTSRLNFKYQADLSRTVTDDHYHSIISDKYVYLLNRQVFIYPLTTQMDADITVQIEAPKSWHTVASWQKQKDIYFPSTFDELSNSMLASGDYRIYHFDAVSTGVTLAIRWAQEYYDEAVVKLMKQIISASGQLFGMFPASKLAVICNQFERQNRHGVGFGGSGAGNGVVLALIGYLSEEDLSRFYHLLSHELLHWWIHGSNSDDSTYWFSEGFTDYYTWLVLRRAEIISQVQWYNKLYQAWQRTCENPKLQVLSLREASLNYFDDRLASRLCYDKLR